jgi:hypothetical protein
MGVLIWGISRPPSPGCGESYESMYACGSSMHQECSNYALINLLVGLCMFVWVVDLLVTFPSPHLRAPAHPFNPKVLRARERAPTPYPFAVFTLWTHGWIHQRVWGWVGDNACPTHMWQWFIFCFQLCILNTNNIEGVYIWHRLEIKTLKFFTNRGLHPKFSSNLWHN